MAKQIVEQVAEANAEALTRGSEAAEKIVEGDAEAFTQSNSTSQAAVEELSKAYQDLATRNTRNLTAAMQALATAKSPVDFIELQQRLIKEGVQTAIRDSQRIAELTTVVLTRAFEPIWKRMEAVHNSAQP
jgi:phasin family protein